MKKIVFLMPFYAFPVPSTMGGGVEELMTILLEEHAKDIEADTEFYFITKQLYGTNKKLYDSKQEYKNSKIIKIKYNQFLNNCIRATNRVLKKLHINKRFSNIYYNKAYNEIVKINPDLIIMERDYDVITKKLIKKFGKEKLSFHIHTQILNKEKIDDYFDSIITVSNFISEDWKNYLSKSSKMKHFVLPNCVNEDRFIKQISEDERKSLRAKFEFLDDDFVSIFCGRICEDKGIDKLIDAILRLDDHHKLLIVGSVSAANKEKTPFLTKIEEMAKSNPNKIKTTGYIANNELYKYYECADIQIIPSMWEEAAGLVAVEGQICGLPQIITKSGGMIEFASPDGTIIIKKDENIVSSLMKQIEYLSSNKKILKEMSEKNKSHGLIFNKKTYYENFKKIIEKY